MAGLGIGFAVSTAAAHEFWLEPDDFAPAAGSPVRISHYIGRFFNGNSYPFVRSWYEHYRVADATGEQPVEGVDGDDPAATLSFAGPGLQILTYQSRLDFLGFAKWEKFAAYLEREGLDHIAPLHRQQGKPEADIRELYMRCAKALIGVGTGDGTDRKVGMPLELIADRNPYQLGTGESLPVRLLYKGKPAAGVTIKAFSKADPKNPARSVTDGQGRALIALPHRGAYLLNAVHMVEPEADENSEWKSFWASLTFASGLRSVSQ